MFNKEEILIWIKMIIVVVCVNVVIIWLAALIRKAVFFSP